MIKDFKNIIFIFCITIFIVLFIPVKTMAMQEITKNLILAFDTPHIFAFDEKILRYEFEKENLFKVEFPAGIFNTKQEMLITPVQNLNNRLTVWTEEGVYNFNILFVEAKKIDIDNSESSGWLSKFLLSFQKDKGNSETYDIDSPPVLLENQCGMTSFDLDSPPKLKNEELN